MNTSEAIVVAKRLQLLHAPTTNVMFHGHSMEPLLTEGDRIASENVSSADIRIGDIVTYLYEDKYPTRRVVSIKGSRVAMWCDNWPERRFWTERNQVLSRVVSRKRKGNILSRTDDDWIRLTTKALHQYRVSQVRHIVLRIRHRISGVWLTFTSIKN
ncbi:MAG: hypothetical protein ACJAYC_001575 [Halieaceae bacterium]|jgi:hypothetical protein